MIKNWPIHIGDDLSLLTTPDTGVTVDTITTTPLDQSSLAADTAAQLSAAQAAAALTQTANTLKTAAASLTKTTSTTPTIPAGTTILSTAGTASTSNNTLYIAAGIIALAFVLKNRM